jgi:hypothetical protein
MLFTRKRNVGIHLSTIIAGWPLVRVNGYIGEPRNELRIKSAGEHASLYGAIPCWHPDAVIMVGEHSLDD